MQRISRNCSNTAGNYSREDKLPSPLFPVSFTYTTVKNLQPQLKIPNRKSSKMTEAYIRNKPGMASVKDMPLLQDGPPPGGFAPIRYARRIPNTGPSAMAIFLTTFGVFSWGMYQVGKGNKIRRALKEEKFAARRAILPVLQAEEDERFVKEWHKYLEDEARIMKDVPGWKVGENVYHSGRWMPPASGELRPDIW